MRHRIKYHFSAVINFIFLLIWNWWEEEEEEKKKRVFNYLAPFKAWILSWIVALLRASFASTLIRIWKGCDRSIQISQTKEISSYCWTRNHIFWSKSRQSNSDLYFKESSHCSLMNCNATFEKRRHWTSHKIHKYKLQPTSSLIMMMNNCTIGMINVKILKRKNVLVRTNSDQFGL
jgi:hypothetical protein